MKKKKEENKIQTRVSKRFRQQKFKLAAKLFRSVSINL